MKIKLPTNEDELRQFFEYHPVKTEKRNLQHKAVNDGCYELGKIFLRIVDDPDYLRQLLNNLSTVRMLANAVITWQELAELAELESAMMDNSEDIQRQLELELDVNP